MANCPVYPSFGCHSLNDGSSRFGYVYKFQSFLVVVKAREKERLVREKMSMTGRNNFEGISDCVQQGGKKEHEENIIFHSVP
jgi:hypothetical protein